MNKKKVFLSFEINDLQKIQKSGILEATSKHEFELHGETLGMPPDNDQSEDLKNNLRKKIKNTDMTLCLVGNNTHKCGWVNWQLVESAKQGKPVVAMALKGITRAYFPKYLDGKNTTVYEWDFKFLNHLLETPEKQGVS